MGGGSLSNNRVSDTSGSGISIADEGQALMWNGVITGSAFGVSVPGGSFVMTEGESDDGPTSGIIQNCTAVGVNITGGTALIAAGEISGNTGVKVANGTFQLEGAPLITGTGAGVVLDDTDKFITVSGEMSNDVPIVVKYGEGSGTGVFTNTAEEDIDFNDAGRFVSNREDLLVGKNSDGQLLLGTAAALFLRGLSGKAIIDRITGAGVLY